MDHLTTNAVATIIVALIALIGGIVVIVHPETLSFEDYVKNVGIAAGLLAIGRGLDQRAKV